MRKPISHSQATDLRQIDKWAVNESWSGHKLRDMTHYFKCLYIYTTYWMVHSGVKRKLDIFDEIDMVHYIFLAYMRKCKPPPFYL